MPAPEPMGRAGGSKDRLSTGASPNLVQPRIHQSGLGEQRAETGELVIPRTLCGGSHAAFRGGGKVRPSLERHGGKGTLKIGVGRERRAQPGPSQPAAFPAGRVGSIKSRQPFACFLFPVQCLAAGPLSPRGSGSGHLPGCAVMLLAGGSVAPWVPWEPIPGRESILGSGMWDTGVPKPLFFPGFQLKVDRGSGAESQWDLGGSPSSRFAGILQGNFTPAANGDVSMGMWSQTLRFPRSLIALSGHLVAWASSQGDRDMYVPGCSMSQLLMRSQGRGWQGTEHPQSAPLPDPAP